MCRYDITPNLKAAAYPDYTSPLPVTMPYPYMDVYDGNYPEFYWRYYYNGTTTSPVVDYNRDPVRILSFLTKPTFPLPVLFHGCVYLSK